MDTQKPGFFQTHKKPIIIAGAALAVGASAYLLSSQPSAGSDPLSPDALPGPGEEGKVIAPSPTPGKRQASASDTVRKAASKVAQKVGLVKVWRPATFPLAPGMKGDAVGALQVALNRLGAGIAADGMFGGDTEKALTRFNYRVPVSLADYNAISQQSTKQKVIPGETAYQRLVRLGFSPASEIQPAQKLRDIITSKFATSSDQVESIFKGPIKTQTNILRAYRLLYGSKAVTDLRTLSFATLRLNSLLNRLEPLDGISGLGAAPSDEAVMGVLAGLGCAGKSNCGCSSTAGLGAAPSANDPDAVYATSEIIVRDGISGRNYSVKPNTYIGQYSSSQGGRVYLRYQNRVYVVDASAGIRRGTALTQAVVASARGVGQIQVM